MSAGSSSSMTRSQAPKRSETRPGLSWMLSRAGQAASRRSWIQSARIGKLCRRAWPGNQSTWTGTSRSSQKVSLRRDPTPGMAKSCANRLPRWSPLSMPKPRGWRNSGRLLPNWPPRRPSFVTNWVGATRFAGGPCGTPGLPRATQSSAGNGSYKQIRQS